MAIGMTNSVVGLKKVAMDGSFGALSIAITDNTEYRLTSVTSLTLTYPTGNFQCWLGIQFASSGTVTLTLPSSSMYIGGVPEIAKGGIYELSIKDNVVAWAEVVSE